MQNVSLFRIAVLRASMQDKVIFPLSVLANGSLNFARYFLYFYST